MTTDDVLARLGLQTRMRTTDYLLPTLGMFGVGMIVGAGLGLLFAPRTGAEMRAEIGRRASRMRHPFRRMREAAELEDVSREELYRRAQEMGIEGRAEMSNQELYDAISGHGH